MAMFMREYLWNLAIVSFLAIAGGFGVIPFLRDLKFPLLLAPLMGLLFIVLGTAGLYTIIGQPVATCGLITASLCLSLTGISLWAVRSSIRTCKALSSAGSTGTMPSFRGNYNLIIFTFVIIAVLTYITNYSSIFLGQSAFLFMDGSDHLGYAHLADWLNTHVANQRPEINILLPYQSWPAFMFVEDQPRFGSLFSLALFAALRGQSGMFAYDDACAVILAVGILGVAAVFSRSRTSFILLSIALLSAHWLDLSRAGYFGKILAYPAILALAGLYMITARPFSIARIVLLVALSCAVTAMHHYLSTSLFLIILGGSFIVLHVIDNRRRQQKQPLQPFVDDLGVLGLLILMSVATGGIISRAFYSIGNHPIDGDWSNLLLNMFDLQLIGIATENTTLSQLTIMLVFSSLIALFYYLVARYKKDYVAASLLAGSAILYLGIYATNAKWQAYQLVGTFYPWFLCAATRCIDNTVFANTPAKLSLQSLTMVGLLCLVTLFHEPFFITVWHRFASEKNIYPTKRFVLPEFDQIANRVGKQPLTVDLPNVMYSLPVLVELGRRNMTLQWTAQTWNDIVNYRHWPTPAIAKAHFWLTLNTVNAKQGCTLAYKTIQYNLWTCTQPR